MKKISTKIQPINEHQIEIDKIANDMAVLFEKKITASQLAKWLTVANNHCNHNDIVWGLGYNVLPELIEAKTKEDRISFLKKKLPEIFSAYIIANKFLFQLSEDYFKENKGLVYFVECIEEFTSPLLTLFAICEMFENYEYEKSQMTKESVKAA